MLMKSGCAISAELLPSRKTTQYPFPAPAAFVSDKATRLIDTMFKEASCARVILLNCKMEVVSNEVQLQERRLYKDTTLIKIDYTREETKTTRFRNLNKDQLAHQGQRHSRWLAVAFCRVFLTQVVQGQYGCRQARYFARHNAHVRDPFSEWHTWIWPCTFFQTRRKARLGDGP